MQDPESWIIDFFSSPNWLLLFEADFRPKAAFDGFVEALQELP